MSDMTTGEQQARADWAHDMKVELADLAGENATLKTTIATLVEAGEGCLPFLRRFVDDIEAPGRFDEHAALDELTAAIAKAKEST